MNAFEKCHVSFLQEVTTPVGKGLVQGILRTEDGELKVIVSHKPNVLPPEMLPAPSVWKLMYYHPWEIKETGIPVPVTDGSVNFEQLKLI